MNRLNLSQESVNLAKQELQQVMSRLASTATMSDKEKLDFNGRWVTWNKKFLIRARLLGGFLVEYITGGVVHPELTIAHERIVGELLLFTVSDGLRDYIEHLGAVGLEAYQELMKITQSVTLPQALELTKKLIVPYDGSVSIAEFCREQINIIEELDAFVPSRQGVWALLALLQLNSPDIVTHLVNFPLPKDNMTPTGIFSALPNICAATNIPFHTAKRSALVVSAEQSYSRSTKQLKCYRCGELGHNFRQCVSTKILDSWKNNKYSKKKLPKDNHEYGDSDGAHAAWSVSHWTEAQCAAFNDSGSWIADSGATVHITNDRNCFSTYEACDGKVFGLSSQDSVVGRGTVPLTIVDATSKRTLNVDLKNVLHIPSCQRQLISVGLVTDSGCEVRVENNKMTVDIGGPFVIAERYGNGLYVCNAGVNSTPIALVSSVKAKSLWHKRLAHIGFGAMKALAPALHLSVKGSSSDQEVCDACMKGKATALPYKSSNTKTFKPLELIHTDISGPYRVEGVSGDSWYFVTFIDDFTKYVEVNILEKKSQTPSLFLSFIRRAERHFSGKGYKVANVRSDHGGEYLNNTLNEYFEQNGIHHQLSVPGNSPQNGVAERMNRTLRDKAKCMLSESGLPSMFWDEAILTAAYLYNRVIPSGCKLTPYQSWTGNAPVYKHLRVFGCKAYAVLPTVSRNKDDGKMADNAVDGIMVGYSSNHKAYKIFSQGKIVVSRNVHFDETVFPGRKLVVNKFYDPKHISGISGGAGAPGVIVPEYSLDQGEEMDIEEDQQVVSSDMELVPCEPNTTSVDSSEHYSDPMSDSEPIESEVSHDVDDLPDSEMISSSPPQLEAAPEKLAIEYPEESSDDDLILVKTTKEVVPVTKRLVRTMSEREDDGDIDDWDLLMGLPSKRYLKGSNVKKLEGPESRRMIGYVAEHAYSLENGDPLTFKQAMALPDADKWLHATDEEIKSLNENETWDLVDMPTGRKPIGTKWVFKRKYKSDGSLERYKARLVCTGYSQKYGIDYEETFSPVVRPESIRLLVAIAAQLGGSIHQMDVTTAFLNGKLDEEIYVKQPMGYVQNGFEDKVYKLKKSLYGLKQAPLCWNKEIDGVLTKFGFTRNKADHGVYVKGKGKDWISVALYVDDLLIISANDSEVEKVKKCLSSVFKMKDLGLVEYFLGMKFTKTKTGYHINQSKYIKEILEVFGMADCNPAKAPMVGNWDLDNDQSESVDETLYRSMIGKLLYAANYTRPDISYAVSLLSRYLNCPRTIHLKAAKHVLRYLKGNPGLGIEFSHQPKFSLEAYCDADWAGDKQDRKSTTGYVVIASNGAICWKSKKQSVVSLSTTEAEYMAVGEVTKEVLWIKNMISELHLEVPLPVTIHEDNNGCLNLSKNPVHHSRTKHIDIRHHFLRDHVQSGDITLRAIRSQDMIADMLTKNLGAVQFQKLVKEMGLYELTTRGSVESNVLSTCDLEALMVLW